MLELDLLLLPFFDDCFDNLTDEQQADFERLLIEPDPLIFQWLLDIEQPDDPGLAAICRAIKDHKINSHA